MIGLESIELAKERGGEEEKELESFFWEDEIFSFSSFLFFSK